MEEYTLESDKRNYRSGIICGNIGVVYRGFILYSHTWEFDGVLFAIADSHSDHEK